MITRDIIRELAAFESPENCAITFYYQPPAPQNKSHREDSHFGEDWSRRRYAKQRKKEKRGVCAQGPSPNFGSCRQSAWKWQESEGDLR